MLVSVTITGRWDQQVDGGGPGVGGAGELQVAVGATWMPEQRHRGGDVPTPARSGASNRQQHRLLTGFWRHAAQGVVVFEAMGYHGGCAPVGSWSEDNI